MKLEAAGLFPLNAPPQLCVAWTGNIQPWVWPAVDEERRGKSLRALAAEYGASHETARRTLDAVI
jgi:hypothetical protein